MGFNKGERGGLEVGGGEMYLEEVGVTQAGVEAAAAADVEP